MHNPADEVVSLWKSYLSMQNNLNTMLKVQNEIKLSRETQLLLIGSLTNEINDLKRTLNRAIEAFDAFFNVTF